jgi:type II secretory pathway component PulC
MSHILRPILISLIIFNVGYTAWVLTAKGQGGALPQVQPVAAKFLDGPLFRMSLPPLEHYEQLIRQRNIFSLNQPDIGGAAPESWQNLKLIGVMLDQGEQAVLKNSETHETFFVREDQMIQGATIKQILKDKVVMDEEGRLFEIVR